MTGRSLSYRDLLAIADLPVVLAAATLARFADRMFLIAIVLHGLARFGSPALAGWLGFAAVAPGLLISPLAGALLDRIGGARGITVDMAASAALVAAMIGADRIATATPWVLLALVALFSLTSPLSAAGVRTMLPRLVPAAALDRVNALDTAIFAIADVGGPALAGVLMGAVGPRPTFATIAVIYAIAVGCMTRVQGIGRAAVEGGSMVRDALTGIGAVLRQPTLRGLAVSYTLYQIAWGILTIVVPVSLARAFPVEAASSMTGVLWAGVGLAGGLSALVAGQVRTTGRERQVMAGGMVVTALAAWPVAAGFGLAGLILALLLAGAVAGPIDVGLLTLRQRRTDPAQLGRVLSVSISLNVIGFPLGNAVGGALIGQSVPATFVGAGLAAALGAFAVGMIPSEAN